MPATAQSSLPAPRNYSEEAASRRAEFIREASVRILAALIADLPRTPAIAVAVSVDAAKLLAKALENEDYL